MYRSLTERSLNRHVRETVKLIAAGAGEDEAQEGMLRYAWGIGFYVGDTPVEDGDLMLMGDGRARRYTVEFADDGLFEYCKVDGGFVSGHAGHYAYLETDEGSPKGEGVIQIRGKNIKVGEAVVKNGDSIRIVVAKERLPMPPSHKVKLQ